MKKIIFLFVFALLASFSLSQAQTISTFPWSESFDGTTFPPSTAWTSISGQTDATTPWKRVTSGTNPTCTPHSGAGMIQYNSFSSPYTSGRIGLLMTPPIAPAGQDLGFLFWMYRDDGYNTSADRVNVYVNTTPSKIGATLLTTINRARGLAPVVTTPNGWYQYSVVLPTQTMTTAYVIMEGVSAYGNNIYVDDWSIISACDAITNFNAAVNGNDVTLTWTAPGAPTGYEVSRDGVLLTTVTTPSYTQTNLPNGIYNYCVKALYAGGCMPTSVCKSVTVNGACTSEVKNFIATQDDNCDVTLSFFNSKAPWLRHCVNDVVAGRVGYDETAGNDMTAAMRYTPVDLAEMGVTTGNRITKVAIGVGENMDKITSMELRIWQGGTSVTDAGILVYTQPITNFATFVNNSMNEIVLNTPFVVDATKELRIGYRLVNTAGYPMGRDAGPNVAGKGGLFQCPALNGGAWMDVIVNYSWNWNFSIKALVEGMETPKLLCNLYRDNVLIADHVYENTYLDERINFDVTKPHSYTIKLLCGDVEYGAKTASVGICKNPFVLDNCETKQIGTGTAGVYQYPVDNYYRYSYVQELYDAATLAAQGITAENGIKSISFQYTKSLVATKQITVYLGNTTKTNFSSTSDWVAASGLSQVFSGDITLTNGWVTINFQQPFIYNGTNLVVAINNTSGAYSGNSDNAYLCHATGTNNTTLWAHQDGTVPYNISSPPTGTRATQRNNMQFERCEKFHTLNPNNIYDPNGVTITMNPDPVPGGEGAVITITFDEECYDIEDIIIGGVSQAPITTNPFVYTEYIQPLPKIEVISQIYKHNITATAGANGFITPSGVVEVNCGYDQTFTFTPNTYYIVDKLFVDGAEVEPTDYNSYTFTNVHEAHTIHVTFIKTSWIHLSWSNGGSLYAPNNSIIPDPSSGDCLISGANTGAVSVLNNGIQMIQFIPATGYKISEVFIDGIPHPQDIPTGLHYFYYVTENHCVHVNFVKYTYPVTSAVYGEGVIYTNDPYVNVVGTTMIEHGDSPTYHFLPMPGYKVANVFVDGIDNYDAVINGYYTFPPVTAPHTIDVVFTKMTYTIVSSVQEGIGFVTPLGTVSVTHGDTKTYTFAPANGYRTSKVVIDGEINLEAAINGVYVFTNIDANHTVNVFFEKLRFEMKSIAFENGSITPAGTMVVEFGENLTYTITADEGYEVAFVLVNGENAGAVSTYTFATVEDNALIEVFFREVVGPDEPNVPNDPNDPNGITEYNGISIYSDKNIVHVDNKNLIPVHGVSIFDMFGRTVWQGNVYEKTNSITLDVATGIYVVRIITNDDFTAKKVLIRR